MKELLMQLAQLGPGIAAGARGNGDGMAAFMEGYQRTMQQLDQQKRLQGQDALAADNRALDLEDRERGITRQAAQDARLTEDRQRAQGLQEMQIPGQLAEVGGTAENPEDAQRLIESLMPRLMETFGQGAMAYGQPAVEMAQRTITGRQKKQVEAFVEAAVKTAFVADNPDADPEIVKLPDHIAKILGKDTAKLSELQQFAQLPVGKPAGRAASSKPDFTLGDTRYSADGTPIVTAPTKAKPTGDATPDQVFVVRDGKVIPITKGTAQPGDTPYSPRNQNDTRPVTAGDTADIAGINEALKLADGLNFKPSDTGILPSIGAAAPDAVTNATGFGVGAKQRQGVINLVKQIIGKGLEGGVLRKEDEIKYAKMLPTISDHPDVVQSKIAYMKTALEQKRTVRLDAMRDAGYDVSKFDARAGSTAGATVEYVRDAFGKLVRKP